jgi:hypothetical protein
VAVVNPIIERFIVYDMITFGQAVIVVITWEVLKWLWKRLDRW